MLAIVLMPRHGIFVLEATSPESDSDKAPDFLLSFFSESYKSTISSLPPQQCCLSLCRIIWTFPGPNPYKESCSDQSSMMYAWLYWLPLAWLKSWTWLSAASKSDMFRMDSDTFFYQCYLTTPNQLCHFSAYLTLGQWLIIYESQFLMWSGFLLQEAFLDLPCLGQRPFFVSPQYFTLHPA